MDSAWSGLTICFPNHNKLLTGSFLAIQPFLLSTTEARAIIERLIAVIEQHWDAVCDEAELSLVDRQVLWGRQFLNSYALEGFRS